MLAGQGRMLAIYGAADLNGLERWQLDYLWAIRPYAHPAYAGSQMAQKLTQESGDSALFFSIVSTSHKLENFSARGQWP